jgi:hypothetical protein
MAATPTFSAWILELPHLYYKLACMEGMFNSLEQTAPKHGRIPAHSNYIGERIGIRTHPAV